jgi:hypothetical protein
MSVDTKQGGSGQESQFAKIDIRQSHDDNVYNECRHCYPEHPSTSLPNSYYALPIPPAIYIYPITFGSDRCTAFLSKERPSPAWPGENCPRQTASQGGLAIMKALLDAPATATGRVMISNSRPSR